MNNNIDYRVGLNNDNLDLDKYIDFNQCLNNPVATITINMENVYGKNMTELFRAFKQANNFNDDYQGRGNIFYFDFHSQKFEKNIDYVYVLDRSKTDCIQTKKIISNRKTSNVEFDYVISNKDWVNENTTITELNNNIAKNIAYCLSHSNIQDTNWHVLRQNYYYIASNNVVYIYACDNTCEDLTVQYFIHPDDGLLDIINKSFVVDITNPTQNNMNVKYNTILTGTQEIPLVLPVNITVTEGDYPSEISWSVLQNGIEIISGGPNESVNQPLPPGDYVFQARDSFGDGWNGATYTIRKYDGVVLATGTLENGSVGDFPFTVPAYNIIDYKVALDGVIAKMTQQFKQLFPEKFVNLDQIAYTTIYNGKLYVSIDYNISNPVWLEGNGVEITPLYTNTNLSLTDQEIIDNWGSFGLNVLTLKNY